MPKPGPARHLSGEFEDAIRRKSFAPVYLLYGAEDLLIEETADRIVSAAVDESTRSFNFDLLRGSDADAKRIVSLASSFPMMADRRVVLVRDIDRVGNRELLQPYIDHPSPSTVLILTAVKPDMRQKLFRTIRENGVALEFAQLYENEIPAWVGRRCARMGKNATPEACQLIPSRVGRSLREIQNEIDKIVVFVGEKSAIDADDVEAVVGETRQVSVFELQRSLGQQNAARALEIIERLLRSGEAPVTLIAMLTRYFEKLWLVQELRSGGMTDAKMASELGVSPFFFGEYTAAARKFTSAHLRDCFAALLDADEVLKRSGLEPRLALTLMVYRLIRPGAEVPEFQ